MLIIAALVALYWLIQLALALRSAHVVRPLEELIHAPTPKNWPRLSILVPARDEAAGIEAALRSKLASTYPALEIVAIDDRSNDATGAIIDRLAGEDPRTKAVHLGSLPEGWLGKLHAMKRGLDVATGDWVLFSDADVHLEQGLLERMIAHAEAEELDLVAVFPRMRSVNAWVDGFLVSLLRMLSLTGRVWSANDDRSSIGIGVGAFNLVRRSKLDATNAIELLKMEVADDVALGALFKQSGARCRLYVSKRDVHLVFLDSLTAAAKSLGKGGGMLGFSLILPILFCVLPLVLELGLPIAAIFHGGLAMSAGFAALLIATLTHLVVCRHFSAPLSGILTWPIGQVIGSVLMLRAGLLAWWNQGVYWRDTYYSRSVIEAGKRIYPPSMRVRVTP